MEHGKLPRVKPLFCQILYVIIQTLSIYTKKFSRNGFFRGTIPELVDSLYFTHSLGHISQCTMHDPVKNFAVAALRITHGRKTNTIFFFSFNDDGNTLWLYFHKIL